MENDRNKFWYIDQNMSIDEYYDDVDDHNSVCDECGCPDVEEKRSMWYKINSGDYVEEGEGDGSNWCPYCNTDCQVGDFKEWKKENEEQFFVKGKK